ncbi:hypothetical protein Peur_035062 [Populus x canadensis]
MPSSKESPADADNRTNSWLDSNQSFVVPPVVNSKDISVSVKETLNSSMTMSNETNNISFPSFSEEIPVIAGNTISKSSLDSDQSTTAMPVTNSQCTGVSVNETLNSGITNEIDKVSMLSFSQETTAKSDKPAINSLDPDLSSMDPLVTNSQDTDSINETLHSSSSNEKDKVCMLSSSDNPIEKNSSDSDQSLTAPPVAKSQDTVSEENFYDCQAWLGSDSDDDFFSVRNAKMARKLIVLALVFVAIFGLAAAAGPAPSTTDLPPAEAPLSHDFIGTNDGDAAAAPSADGSTVVPGPMGSTTLAGGPASEKDDAATLKFSAIVGAAAVAGYFFF